MRVPRSWNSRIVGASAVGALAVAVLIWIAISQVFAAVETSTHNNNGNSACAAFVPSQQGSENKGDLNAKKGSFLENVTLPQGATVKQLTLFANDFDADDGTHVFLVRKQIERGLKPQFAGYRVMAATQSMGAVENTMR